MYTPHDQQQFKYGVTYTETDMGMIKNLSDFVDQAFTGGDGVSFMTQQLMYCQQQVEECLKGAIGANITRIFRI